MDPLGYVCFLCPSLDQPIPELDEPNHQTGGANRQLRPLAFPNGFRTLGSVPFRLKLFSINRSYKLAQLGNPGLGILYHIILCYIILYYIILHYIILYYTIYCHKIGHLLACNVFLLHCIQDLAIAFNICNCTKIYGTPISNSMWRAWWFEQGHGPRLPPNMEGLMHEFYIHWYFIKGTILMDDEIYHGFQICSIVEGLKDGLMTLKDTNWVGPPHSWPIPKSCVAMPPPLRSNRTRRDLATWELLLG